MEKAYKLMKRAGGVSIALGIIMVVVGISAGVLSIITGAKLLIGKNNIEF